MIALRGRMLPVDRRICSHRLNPLLAIGIAWVIACPVQGQMPTDLIDQFDPEKQVVSGKWRKSDGELRVGAESGSRAVLADAAPQSYSLTIEFTRTAGDNAVCVILPIGPSQCAFNLSVFQGEAHGIAVVDGKLAKDNSTTIRPGTLETDHPYRLLIEVEVKPEQASISSTLDGRPFLSWRGSPASLSMLDFWKLPSSRCVGLCTYSEFTFHNITLSKLDPTMRMTDATSRDLATGGPRPNNGKTDSSKLISFEKREWAAPNAQAVKVESFQGKTALHIQGREDNFVYLPGTTFQDGTIEVDIASNTFSGVGFRGSPDGTAVEKLYFRPFNSGTEKHENTVQYSLLGRPDFDWRSLRERFPGKYESGANIKSQEWFHVRLEIQGQRLEAYVNDGKEPVLVVEELLGDKSRGVIGVWGWDSYFQNFRWNPKR